MEDHSHPVAVLAAAVLLAAAALWLIFRGRSLDLTMAYDGTSEFYDGGASEASLQKADGFALDLCVGDANVSREGVSLLSRQGPACSIWKAATSCFLRECMTGCIRPVSQKS